MFFTACCWAPHWHHLPALPPLPLSRLLPLLAPLDAALCTSPFMGALHCRQAANRHLAAALAFALLARRASSLRANSLGILNSSACTDRALNSNRRRRQAPAAPLPALSRRLALRLLPPTLHLSRATDALAAAASAHGALCCAALRLPSRASRYLASGRQAGLWSSVLLTPPRCDRALGRMGLLEAGQVAAE